MLSFSLSHAGQFGLSQNEQKSYFSTNFVQQKVVFVSQRCSGEPSKKNYKLVFLLNLRGGGRGVRIPVSFVKLLVNLK